MSEQITRRETFRRGLAAARLLALAPTGGIPALAQGDVEIAFTDIPPNFSPNNPNATSRVLDIRKIDGLITPKDQFFAVQHLGRPEIDGAAHRLKFTGLVKKAVEFSMPDLRGMPSVEVVAGYECSGNSSRSVQGLASCGRFAGVPLTNLLSHVGIGSRARELVFFGADHGIQDVVFRGQTFKLVQQFGRSITLENAMRPEPLVAYALNGEPLTRAQGFPVRLIMPGWYGVANVKWLSEVHVQEDRYLGNYQARWYRSVIGVGGTGEDDDPQTQWIETEVTRMRLKSVIERVSRSGGAHQILGFVLNDGTPVKSVEVQIDNGPWSEATLLADNKRYSWKLFTYRWERAAPGEHTLVSRATDVDGNEQPGPEQSKRKKTFLQDNAQFPRRVMIT